MWLPAHGNADSIVDHQTFYKCGVLKETPPGLEENFDSNPDSANYQLCGISISHCLSGPPLSYLCHAVVIITPTLFKTNRAFFLQCVLKSHDGDVRIRKGPLCKWKKCSGISEPGVWKGTNRHRKRKPSYAKCLFGRDRT